MLSEMGFKCICLQKALSTFPTPVRPLPRVDFYPTEQVHFSREQGFTSITATWNILRMHFLDFTIGWMNAEVKLQAPFVEELFVTDTTSVRLKTQTWVIFISLLKSNFFTQNRQIISFMLKRLNTFSFYMYFVPGQIVKPEILHWMLFYFAHWF